MPVRDPLDDVYLKINWAEKRIADFYVARNAFMDTNPCGYSVKVDNETREPVYYFTDCKPLGTDLPLIAGDVLQNLRTALDYMVCISVKLQGHPVTEYTGFPIPKKVPTTYEERRRFRQKVEGLRQEAIKEIEALKPYQGGDEILWRLHSLNNRDKHRLLFTASAAVVGYDAGQHMRETTPSIPEDTPSNWRPILERTMQTLQALTPPENTWYPLSSSGKAVKLENGTEFLRDLPGTKPNYKMKLPFEIAFYEPGIAEGELMTLVLRESLNRVREVAERLNPFLR
jgi:hypothetical protein